jgi:lipopolysaccharide export system protein LptA
MHMAPGLEADTFTFSADKMSGGRAAGQELTILQGNAVVRSDSILLQADRIEIQGEDNEFIYCTGNISGVDEEKDVHFTAKTLRYDRTLKVARLEGDASLEDRENEVSARAHFIEYDQEGETALLQISVRLFKEEMVCRSEYAVYHREDQTLDLSGFPVVYKKSDEFRADRIRVDLDTEDVTLEGSVSGSIQDSSTGPDSSTGSDSAADPDSSSPETGEEEP